jgi:hypothetical protein
MLMYVFTSHSIPYPQTRLQVTSVSDPLAKGSDPMLTDRRVVSFGAALGTKIEASLLPAVADAAVHPLSYPICLPPAQIFTQVR